MLLPLLFGVSGACKGNAGEGFRAQVIFNPNHQITTTSEPYDVNDGSAEFFDQEFIDNHKKKLDQRIDDLIRQSFLEVLGNNEYLLLNRQFGLKFDSEKTKLREKIEEMIYAFNDMSDVQPLCIDYDEDKCTAGARFTSFMPLSQKCSGSFGKLCPKTCEICGADIFGDPGYLSPPDQSMPPLPQMPPIPPRPPFISQESPDSDLDGLSFIFN